MPPSKPRIRAAAKRRQRLVLVALLAVAAAAIPAVTAAAPPGSSNLRISKSDSPDPARVGSQLTYTIGVENRGPDPATGVTVTDNLPRTVDLISAAGPGGPCAQQGQSLRCPIGTLAPVGVSYGGAQTAITIVVSPRSAGTIRNTATVKGDQKDPASGDNRASATTRVLGPVRCRGLDANVAGTGGADVLRGTPGPDVIAAGGGRDRIVSLAGRDLICAGRGADYVAAGLAADRVFGGAGADRLLGRGGPDLLRGSAGNDVIKGGRGSDRLRGGRGFDRCSGGPGADSVRGCER
jgi:uncharacterized repeat protein (TIGR01451 family)